MLNLLNINYSPEAGTHLCIGVLSTLTSLLAANEASRKQLQLNPGFDSVLRAVLERTAPKGPSGDVLSQVLHLILEVSVFVCSFPTYPSPVVSHIVVCRVCLSAGAPIDTGIVVDIVFEHARYLANKPPGMTGFTSKLFQCHGSTASSVVS